MNKPFIIILDIDGTLCDTIMDRELQEEEMDKSIEYNIRMKLERVKYHSFLREGIIEFINFIIMYFDYIIVFSAGKYDYVDKFCSLVFPKDSLSKIYSMRECETVNRVSPTRKIFKNVYDKHIGNFNLDSTRTMFVDDRSDVLINNNYIEHFNCAKYEGLTKNTLAACMDYIKRWLIMNN